MEGRNLYKYLPNVPAAAIFTVIFSLVTLYHLWLLVRTRTWFCIPFVVGGLFEAIGYAARIPGNSDPGELSLYIVQYLLLLLAPILFAASVYMILGRIIRATKAEEDSIVRVNWLTKIFVFGDALCFLIQCGGGGLQASSNSSTSKTGENIVLAGLILQIVIFFVFLLIAAIFQRRLVQRPTPESLSPSIPWQRLMWFLYGVSILITVRNIFRVIEYATGRDGYLLTHEWTLYIFDAVPMVATLAICITWYQSNLTPRSKGRSAHRGVENPPAYEMKTNP